MNHDNDLIGDEARPQRELAALSTALTAELATRLASIEAKLERLLASQSQPPQAFYSTSDVAGILGKAEWTVREWCRLGRIHAEKRECGRGCAREWMVCHEELERIKSEGLLPLQGYRHRAR